MKKLLTSVLLLGLTSMAQAEIIVLDPWVRLVPPVSNNTAAFMSFKNTSAYPVKLVKVESSDFKMVQFHKTTKKEGMMHMDKSKIIVPADDSLILKPGSYHLMLMGKKNELRPESLLKLILHWDNGNSNIVYARVRRARQ